jgi:3-hydroxybutyryl-CoA dehydrogenase
MNLPGAPLCVVAAGIMGAGIAQVAAMTGHAVRLFDTREGAAVAAKARLAGTLDGLVAKGRLGADAVQATLARISPIATLDEAAGVALVVGTIALVTGVIGFCPLWTLFGINTCGLRK